MSAVSQGIFVACTPAAFFVRIVGRGACRNSVCLREYGLKKFQEGYRKVYVDLRECEAMDSTFLGVFAGFGLSLGDSGKLVLLDLSADNRRALVDLGLDQIVGVDAAPPDAVRTEFPPAAEFEFLPGSDLTVGERPFDEVSRALLMLECHEYLCRLDERNENKFRDVKQFLREDIARHNPGPPPKEPKG